MVGGRYFQIPRPVSSAISKAKWPVVVILVEMMSLAIKARRNSSSGLEREENDRVDEQLEKRSKGLEQKEKGTKSRKKQERK